MSIWKETFHFKSGLGLETYNENINVKKYMNDSGWIKVNKGDGDDFAMVNLSNVELIEFKEVDE